MKATKLVGARALIQGAEARIAAQQRSLAPIEPMVKKPAKIKKKKGRK